MPNKRNKLAIARRRQQVADLYLRGWPQMRIADELGVSQGTISNDLVMIQREWRESSIRDFDLACEVELKKLDRIEREAWDAWDRSQKAAQEARVKGDLPEQTTEKRIRNQYGDPRFLEIIQKCIASRRTLLGLDAPTKVAPTTPDGKPLTFDQRQNHIVAILIEKFGLAAVRELEGSQIDESGNDASGSRAIDRRRTGAIESLGTESVGDSYRQDSASPPS